MHFIRLNYWRLVNKTFETIITRLLCPSNLLSCFSCGKCIEGCFVSTLSRYEKYNNRWFAFTQLKSPLFFERYVIIFNVVGVNTFIINPVQKQTVQEGQYM